MDQLTKSEYVLLGLISKGAQSGYTLKQTLATLGRYYWSESNAQIYPNLKKLEAAGLVTSTLDPKSGGRRSRIYQLTPPGLTVLRDWLLIPCDPTPYREELLLKIGFSHHLNEEERRRLLTHYQEKLQAAVKDCAALIDHISNALKDRSDHAQLLMVYDHVEAILKAKLEWAQRRLGTGR